MFAQLHNMLGLRKDKSNPTSEKEWFTHLLFPFLQVDNDEFIIREAPLGEGQADAVRVGRAATAIKSECWGHLAVMQ